MTAIKEQLKIEYKIIAKFLGYTYFPYSNEKGVQNKEYPGWFNTSMCDLKHPETGECVRILGYKGNSYICRNTIGLNFKFDWNMLMKVVKFIETIKNTKYGGFNVIIEGDNCLIQSRNKTKSSAYSKSYLGNGNKLNAVYYSCLMFIEWYNENILK